MLTDSHVHIERGEYTKEWIDRFIETGKKKGIEKLCITEHVHLFQEFKDIPSMLIKKFGENKDTLFMKEWWSKNCKQKLDLYVQFIEDLKREGYPLKLGMEVDWLGEEPNELIQEVISKYPWDILIGSVHWIRGWGFDHPDRLFTWKKRDIYKVYENYFSLIKEAAQSKMFDVIGHLDVIKLFGIYPEKNWLCMVKKVINIISEVKVAVEVNTAGLRKPVGEIYPKEEFLDLLKDKKVPLTLSSDAHNPEDVGCKFKEVLKILKKKGYKKLIIFNKRNPSFISII